jgi:ATP-binding cassette subfamily G (WHITE) protein 2 (PDR)
MRLGRRVGSQAGAASVLGRADEVRCSQQTPQLLTLFSGLDSQTSWSILDLMVKLRDNGQAILCTIHQPSAMLFQRFDKLLFLAKGGKTIYYGDIGENSKTMTGYFEANGASRCPPEANPAEWILQVCGAAPGAHTDQDWHQTWRDSKEYQEVREQLDEYKRMEPKRRSEDDEKAQQSEFAAPFGVQFVQVTRRVAQQLWRTPSYIVSPDCSV